MAAPMPEPAYVRAADLVILFYIYGNTRFIFFIFIERSRDAVCSTYKIAAQAKTHQHINTRFSARTYLVLLICFGII